MKYGKIDSIHKTRYPTCGDRSNSGILADLFWLLNAWNCVCHWSTAHITAWDRTESKAPTNLWPPRLLVRSRGVCWFVYREPSHYLDCRNDLPGRFVCSYLRLIEETCWWPTAGTHHTIAGSRHQLQQL